MTDLPSKPESGAPSALMPAVSTPFNEDGDSVLMPIARGRPKSFWRCLLQILRGEY